ncbi:CRISPR-associated endonuclease Cas2 [Patescibacteria group bacterium]|nr:MAG: CRISPR-associated endonuclease Cas2 [Patescibacteria group bacterium]
MKGETRLKILELIENSAQAAEELFFIFTVPYGTSRKGAEYLLNQRRKKIELFKDSDYRKRHLRFNDLLYRLRKEELVEKNGGKKLLIKLTAKGRQVLERLRQRKQYNPSKSNYEAQKDGSLKIIIFDIPEAERTKRAWLREVLKNLEFKMLQKSVWAGKVKLPEKFIRDLETLRLLPFVEIFAIDKRGTLKRIE